MTPTPDRIDSPDAPPTTSLRCPRCGGEPVLSVEDHSPTFPSLRFWAAVSCCGRFESGEARTANAAANAAAGRWLRLYPSAPEES